MGCSFNEQLYDKSLLEKWCFVRVNQHQKEQK
jgi:hypothetical protein